MGVESFVLVFVISRLIELVLLCVCAAPDVLSSATGQVAKLLAMDDNMEIERRGPQDRLKDPGPNSDCWIVSFCLDCS